MESAALNVYRAYPLELRADLVLSYDLEVVTKDKEALVLHHKITPFRMSCRGNLWLQLCHVALTSSQRKENVAVLCNAVSGDRYLLEGGHFVLSQPLRFTEEEYKILRWILQEYTDKQMCFLLGGMSLNTFKSKKKRLFTKLGVKSMAGAIHKVHLLGLV